MYGCIVIGSGPAALTAAIYLSRSDTNHLVIEGNQPGGQLTLTSDIENYPGFPQKMTGAQLMENMRRQAEGCGSVFRKGVVIKIHRKDDHFALDTEDALGHVETVFSHAVIIATGASAQFLGLPEEEGLIGMGVSACAVCDGALFRDKDVAVVGGGDTAMEEAIFLTHFARSVTIIHRRDGFRASEVMLNRARLNPKIRWSLFKAVEAIHTGPTKMLSSVTLRDMRDDSLSDMPLDGLFIAIGHKPNVSPFQSFLACDEHGYIKTNGDTTATSVAGVFACGDVADPRYRQAITAAGSGCKAAMDAKSYLDNLFPGSCLHTDKR
ncbi:MAG: thioredoxin-disulfide reductase [Proteobacteria bacterium]|nr:thioredoxin-disulfide reductase [Pseudomonadota bacterium]